MKHLHRAIFYLVFALPLFCTLSAAAQSKLKPNIILIVADDLGYKDVGFMGSSYYNTPNLDKLASQSILFTNAYAGAANCAPSRACLMSGQNTPAHGIYTVGTSERGDKETRRLIPTKNNEILPDSIVTLAETLKSAGYYTGTIGKWHLGKDPHTQGFDFNVGGNMKGANKYFVPYENSAITDGPKGEYMTDRLGNEAVKFVDEHHDKPFFLYLPYYAVHTPLQAQDNIIAKYKNKKGSNGQDNPVYAAMIESLDANIGKLLNRLEDLHLSENTIVIFTSDNGGIRSISQQDPLRAGKGSYYEGGIRVPLVIRWPGYIKPGVKSDVPVTNMDFYPTVLDLLKLPAKPILEGRTLIPVIQGVPVAERPLFWHFPIYLQAYDMQKDNGRDPWYRTRPGSAMRLGDWKLHQYFEDNSFELYNLKTDPGEKVNVAAKNPEVLAKLKTMLKDWQVKTNAPIPTKKNPAYDPNFKPKPKARGEGGGD